MKVDVAVLGSPSVVVPVVSVDAKEHLKKKVLSELGSCVKVEVNVQGSLS